ncbi:hypothetical protein [Neisseria sp. CCUG12390]|uniref:EamA family transporter n=1 Tax=Neisseria sp. CCUG12390 TaxID=3392035 RepID=UPI003A0FD465
MKFFLFLMVAALGNVLYHTGQKSLHDITANPMTVLAVYYAAALVLCLALIPWFGKVSLSDTTALAANWRVWLVSAGILLIELGFLLAYQSGGSAQWSGVVVNGMAALLLIPLAVWIFGEQFSWQKVLGILLTLSGLYFLVKK